MSLVVQWLRPLLPMQGVWVQSLGRELDFTYLQQQTRQSNKYVSPAYSLGHQGSPGKS